MQTHVRVLLARLALAILGASELSMYTSTMLQDLHVRRVLHFAQGENRRRIDKGGPLTWGC